MDQSYQNGGYHGKYPSAPTESSSFQDYPAPSYEQVTTPIISMQQPSYQTLIQTQVILVGGCPACRLVN